MTLAAILVVLGCATKKSSKDASTPAFDSIIARTEKIYDSGNKQQALDLMMAARRSRPDMSLADEMNYFTWCGETYRKDYGNEDKYIAFADSIIQTLERNFAVERLPHRYIQALNMKADAFFEKGLYNESYDFYFQAKKKAKESGDSCSLSQFSYSLGMVLYRQQRFTDAAIYFNEAVNEISHCKNEFVFFYRRQELFDNIGLSYYHAGKYDEAMQYYQRALAYIDSNYLRFDKRESVYIAAKAVVYGNMADLYILLKNYDTAAALLKKSASINLQKGYANSDAMLEQVKLAKVFFTTGKLNDMKALLYDIRAELDSLPDVNVTLAWNYLMWQYCDSTKDFNSGYSYLKKYVLLRDSLQSNEKRVIASDADERIKSLERQYQIALLNKSSLLSEVYLAIAAIIVLMALIIILLILRNVKKSSRNIRELTRLNNQVNEQKEKLQEALTGLEFKDKEKSRILRSAAHDILNPLSAISGLANMLIAESDNFNAEQKEILSLIKEACDNSISLSRDILEASTPNELMILPKEWVNVNKLLSGCVDLLSLKAASKKQQLFLSAGPDKVEAYINKEKIRRAINNLLNNAIKFSYDNSVIRIRLDTDGENVEISVIDSGIGIAEKNKPLVFDMFSEAKTPGTRGEAPHGLGLSISLRIAQAHHGTIWFESETGKGSTFHLVFPLKAAE